MLPACSSHSFQLESPDFKNNAYIPHKYAYCQSDGQGRIKAGGNMSPPLAWSSPPKATRSFVLLMSDSFIPDSSRANQQGYSLDQLTPRMTDYHWVLVNIPDSLSSLPAGAGSKGIVPGGKPPGDTMYGLGGLNNFGPKFKSSATTQLLSLVETNQSWQGVYGQYDGPCPPWNDKVIHHYLFALYALDVAQLDLPHNGCFTGSQVLQVMQGHILAIATLGGKYTTYRH